MCSILYGELRFKREGLVSSGSYHWTRQDLDTCPRVDTCPQSNVSNDNKLHPVLLDTSCTQFFWTRVQILTCPMITSTGHKLHLIQKLSIPYRWDYILITIKICYKLDKYVILCAPVLNRYVINLINNYKNMVLSNTLNHIVTKIFRDKLKQYFGNGTDNFGYLS